MDKEKYRIQENNKLITLQNEVLAQTPLTASSVHNKLLLSVLSALAEIKVAIMYPEKKHNPSGTDSHEELVPTAGIAKQLPKVAIPYDCEVSLVAPPANTGTIYIGKSKQDAENHKCTMLVAGESVEYKIDNLSVLWIDSSVSGEGIIWTVEQDG